MCAESRCLIEEGERYSEGKRGQRYATALTAGTMAAQCQETTAPHRNSSFGHDNNLQAYRSFLPFSLHSGITFGIRSFGSNPVSALVLF
jgi:hypothetical protein